MCSSHRSARDGIAVFEVDLVADMECLGGALEVPWRCLLVLCCVLRATYYEGVVG